MYVDLALDPDEVSFDILCPAASSSRVTAMQFFAIDLFNVYYAYVDSVIVGYQYS